MILTAHLGITIYGPEIFTIAGIAAADRQWVVSQVEEREGSHHHRHRG